MAITAQQRLERHGQRTVPLYLAEAVTRWPTPQAYSHGPDSNPPGITKLDIEVREMYPTPTSRDRGSDAPSREGGPSLSSSLVGGQLNADWVSLLMGFPPQWTVVDGSAECPESPPTSASASPDSED